jgi:hypothetical protein
MAAPDFSLNQFVYIAFGWLLGLVSPVIVESIKSKFRSREVIKAIRVELEDVQFRLAVTSFLLIQNYGNLNREFLLWIQRIVDKYRGNEPSDNLKNLIARFVATDDSLLSHLAAQFKAKEGVGSNLKTYRVSFLEMHLADVANLSVPAQRRIHEFRNQLDILNQEIQRAIEYMRMTFNSSLSEENHQIVKVDLEKGYLNIQSRCKAICDRIDAVLEEI